MRALKLALGALVLAVGLLAGSAGHTSADIVGKLATQPHPDLFSCGTNTCDVYNPATIKVKATHAFTWNYVVVSGCVTNGNTAAAVDEAMTAELAKVQVTGTKVSTGADVTIYGSCGVAFNNVCGGPPVIGCLGRGYPYNDDIDLSLDMDGWSFDVSRVSVVLHELVGHALGSWNEQYCLGTETSGPCAGQPQFSPAPNHVDIMNTGPNSRHYLGTTELQRWDRTMWDLDPSNPNPTPPPTCQLPAAVCANYASTDAWGAVDPTFGDQWNGTVGRWVFPNGWATDPSNGYWWNPNKVLEWGECDTVHQDCWNWLTLRWVFKGSVDFDPATGIFSSPPIG